MLKQPLMKTRTLALAAGLAAAFMLGDGVAQAQSGSAGSGYGSGMGSGMDSGTNVYPAPSGASGGSGAATPGAPGTYPGTGASGMGTDGAGTGTNGAGMGTAGPDSMGAPGTQTYGTSTEVGPSARGVDPGVYPLISNDSIYPDPRAGMPTGARQRRGAW